MPTNVRLAVDRFLSLGWDPNPLPCHLQEKHQQRFFLGHNDDVLSVAIHPNRMVVASGQCGKPPCVCVWDAMDHNCKMLVKLPYE